MSLACVSETQGDFFRAMGIPLLRGRFFTESDKAGAPLVAIVNRKLAGHYWPGQNPIGKRLRLGMPEWQMPWLTIVGEVADVKRSLPADGNHLSYVFSGVATEDEISGDVELGEYGRARWRARRHAASG
jgi:hypothetical protein